MSFLKTSLYSGIGTIINLTTRLISNKILAIYLGTNGLFLMGQLRDFLKITSTASSLGTSDGLVKYISQYKEDSTQLNQYLSCGFKIHLFSSIIIAIFTLLFRDFLSVKLFKTDIHSNFFALLAFSLITFALYGFILNTLNGLKKIKTYIIITSLSSITAALISIALVIKYNIDGALYAIALSQIISFIFSLFFVRVKKTITLSQLLLPIQKKYLNSLSKFSIMALISPFFLVSATLFVRNFILKEFDENHAGSWEGMWRISAMYILFVTSTLKFYLLPTFSSLNGIELKKEVFKIWKFTLPPMLLTVLLIYLFKDFLITTLFSKDFKLIGMLIGFHLIGDIIKIMSWILGNLIISKAKTKIFIFLQLEWSVIFVILTIIFINVYGFIGISIAYMCAYIIHFLIMNIYFRKLLWLKN